MCVFVCVCICVLIYTHIDYHIQHIPRIYTKQVYMFISKYVIHMYTHTCVCVCVCVYSCTHIQIMSTYHARLTKIPCKHFDCGEGDCPFGTSCFYEHRYKDGSLQQPTAPRLKVRCMYKRGWCMSGNEVVCVCVCVCVCIYIYIYNTYMYIYICIYTCVYIYIYICIYIHVRIHIYMHTQMYRYIYIHTYMCVYTFIFSYFYFFLYMKKDETESLVNYKIKSASFQTPRHNVRVSRVWVDEEFIGSGERDRDKEDSCVREIGSVCT